MRKLGWHLPYHPLQVTSVFIDVFLSGSGSLWISSQSLGSSFSFFIAAICCVVGISTYDYIVAMSEQEQQGARGQQNAGMSMNSSFKRMIVEESARKMNMVPKAAAEARKKSEILQPVLRHEVPQGQGSDSSFGSSSGWMAPRPGDHRHHNKRGRSPVSARATEQ
ncbi:putative S-acyltransferase [Acorus calamus]|uniref:S-acyltransferase n=1 Tax=Acorus calamus TaxID=4465 RepID=A0AAV9DXN2_ACOCL|nr:putative S-acyltransferase [Acorus calamus]